MALHCNSYLPTDPRSPKNSDTVPIISIEVLAAGSDGGIPCIELIEGYVIGSSQVSAISRSALVLHKRFTVCRHASLYRRWRRNAISWSRCSCSCSRWSRWSRGCGDAADNPDADIV